MRWLFLLVAFGLHGQTQPCGGPPPGGTEIIKLPGKPFALAETKDGCWIFAAMPVESTGIAVLSRKSGRVQLARTAPMEGRYFGMVLSHDGKMLMVAADERVVFLDVDRLTSGKGDPLVGSVATGQRAESIWANVTVDDKFLFVADEYAAEISVIDVAARAILGKIPVGIAPIALTFSKDGKYLFNTSQGAKKEWNWPAACTQEGRRGATEIVNPEGAISVIDVAKARTDPAKAVVHRVPAGCSPVRLSMSPAGDRLYTNARNSNAVIAFDTAKLIGDPDHARVGRVEVGTAPVPILVFDGGKRLLAGNSNRFAGSNEGESLTVVDTAKMAVTGSIPAGAFPRDLKLSADGSTVYLANFGSNTLQAMDAGKLPVK